MSDALLLVTFLSIVVVLSILTRRLNIPYPIPFVIGGVGLAFAATYRIRIWTPKSSCWSCCRRCYIPRRG